MTKPPVVALVGRVNVGKSRLFNRLLAFPRAIVSRTPGTTRDRNYAQVEWRGVPFIITDTGGLIDSPSEELLPAITKQTLRAIAEANLVLLVLDAHDGVTPVDREIAGQLRHPKRPMFAVVNKVDSAKERTVTNEGDYYSLGVRAAHLVSAKNGAGTGDLLDGIVETLGGMARDTEQVRETAIAVLGQPNVGKSSLVNALIGDERMIVHASPHTTREPHDTRIKRGDATFRIIDTAGIRRRKKGATTLETLSVSKSISMIKEADVVLLVVDIADTITSQDRRLARLIADAKKPAILIANKWDMLPTRDEETIRNLTQYLARTMSGFGYAPRLFISATKGTRVAKILPLVRQLHEEASRELTPEEIDSIGIELGKLHRDIRGTILITQMKKSPPTFRITLKQGTTLSRGAIGQLEKRFHELANYPSVPVDINVHVADA